MPTYSWDQVAEYLRAGYWASGNESWRAFALDGSRTITYDISRLSPEAQSIAVSAMASWSTVTGINFVSVGGAPTLYTETSDAGVLGATSYVIGTNSVVSGTISTRNDIDDYAVTLTAGQTYLFALSSYPGKTLGDAILRLYNSSGALLSTSDSSEPAAGEYINFTATTTGTYYVSADGYLNTTGTYDLSVQVAAGITFNDMDDTGAYAFSDITGNTIQRSYVNIADNWSALTHNGYLLQTYIHELGHALGLGHAGPYNATPGQPLTYANNRLYDNDSWLTSVMSYFDQLDNTVSSTDSLAFLATMMPADVIAIQNLYGAGASGYQSGNTVWGPGGNVGGTLQTMLDMSAGLIAADPLYYQGQPIAYMIYDTGGTDTFDVSAFSMGQEILLNELQYSNIGGLVDNVVIARGTVIENAIGGAGADTIVGNTGNNVLTGKGGADNIDGGMGSDTASYSSSAGAVQVNLALVTAQVSTGDASGDILTSIENLVGSAYADTLLGTSGINSLNGGGGADVLDGRGGSDFIFGADGDDTIVFNTGLLAANVQGGIGTDTLLINDGTLPTGFNLVTAGIEQATWLRHDLANNQAWSLITDSYDTQWRLLSSVISYDNNSRIETYYDVANAQNYQNVRNDYNASNQRTATYYLLDTGATSNTFFDVGNTQNYQWTRADYDTQSRMTYSSYLLDNGVTSQTYYDAANAAAWTSSRSDLNANGVTTFARTYYDNGTREDVSYDADNVLNYQYVRQLFDASNRLTYNSYQMDNGTISQIYYDAANAGAWASSRSDVDTLGRTTFTSTTNDDNTRMDVYYDVNNQYAWNTLTYYYDASLNLINTVYG